MNQIKNWQHLSLAFVAFSLCASSAYIINDLFDLESDRVNLYKSKRPFALGHLSVLTGVYLAPLLFACSLAIAQYVNVHFLYWILIYFTITFFYSCFLKRIVLIDCLTLAGLYTLRILAGGVAINVKLSFWLLTFSVFLFLSLAFIKRHTELKMLSTKNNNKAHGRGFASDVSFVEQVGLISGFISVLVLTFYLNSENVIKLYNTPEFIWGAILSLLIWNHLDVASVASRKYA